MTIIKFAGSWGSFEFNVDQSSIIGVKDLNISVSVETENKTAGKENYAKRKNYNPAEITMTGIFSTILGVQDVKASSWALMDIIRQGRKGYFYSGSSKVIAPMLMGTSAKASKIEIGPNGAWTYCEVTITLKQCEKFAGGSSGKKKKGKKKGGKSSSKKSGKKQSVGGSDKRITADSERKKQMEQAKQNARETNGCAARASIKSKLGIKK